MQQNLKGQNKGNDDIYTFSCKAVLLQQLDDAAVTTATHIKRPAALVAERNGTLVLTHAVAAIEIVAVPKVSELIVAGGYIYGIHLVVRSRGLLIGRPHGGCELRHRFRLGEDRFGVAEILESLDAVVRPHPTWPHAPER